MAWQRIGFAEVTGSANQLLAVTLSSAKKHLRFNVDLKRGASDGSYTVRMRFGTGSGVD